MIATTKLVALMTAMTLVGAGTPLMAAAQEANVDIERSNQHRNVIDGIVCTNESDLGPSEEGEVSQFADVDATESNDCEITQTQSGSNTGSVDDLGFNDFDSLAALLADFF